MRYYGVQNEVKAYCNRLQNETSITVTPSLVKTLNDRVESLKKSGVWSQFGLGFNDNDGDEYLQRASVTDILGRSEVLWFVRGMKSLGLWQNMVCWPLRSYQNAGTGSTVYSLGGLGVFDGTMFNSPTWGVDGLVSSSGVDRYIQTSNIGNVINKDPNKLTFITCVKNQIVGSGFTGQLISFKFGPQDIGLYGLNDTLVDSRFTLTGGTVSSRRTMSSSSYEFISSLCRNFKSQIYLNGDFFIESTNQVSGTVAFNDSSIEMAGTTTTGTGSRTYGFCCYFENKEINQKFVYNIYKQTLGSNLSLP